MKNDYSDLKLHYQKCFFKELYGIEYDDFIKLKYRKEIIKIVNKPEEIINSLSYIIKDIKYNKIYKDN